MGHIENGFIARNNEQEETAKRVHAANDLYRAGEHADDLARFRGLALVTGKRFMQEQQDGTSSDQKLVRAAVNVVCLLGGGACLWLAFGPAAAAGFTLLALFVRPDSAR